MRRQRRSVGVWLRCLALLAAAALSVPASFTEPYDPNLGTAIDTFLSNQGSPIVSNGSVFFSNGITWNVDPRLIVAIAGAESSFGLHICSAFNAWNWFWNGFCASPFGSWSEGIGTVTKFMRRSYLNKGYTSIPLIGSKYCASGCQNWVPNVTTFYTGVGGDVTDLAFVAPNGPSPIELYSTPLFNDPNLVSYYRFEGGATDSKGSNNGAAFNVAYSASYGRFGQGSSYASASASYINAGDPTDFQFTGDFSINAWIYLLSCPSLSTKMVAKWNESGNNRSYGLAVDNNSLGCRPYSNISPDGTNVGPYYTNPANAISTNTWHMVSFVRSGGSQYLYVDGILASSGPATNPYNSGTNSHLVIGGGGGENWAGANISLDAYLDDLSIFNRVLTATEISKLYMGNWP